MKTLLSIALFLTVLATSLPAAAAEKPAAPATITEL